MRYLFSWILNHIKNSKDISIEEAIKKIGSHVAEIDYISHITLHKNLFTCIEVIEKNSLYILGKSYEFNQIISLPFRDDVSEMGSYIVFNENNEWIWGAMKHFGGIRESLLPAFSFNIDEIKGSWKNKIITNDYVIEIGNTTLGMRSDLYGHRGLAREVAVLFNKELTDEISIFPEFRSIQYNHPSIEKNISEVNFFSYFFINNIEQKNSDIKIAIELSQIDIKPKNIWIDLTNYVMADIGHPIHIWDKDIAYDGIINIKKSKIKKITLLDSEIYELETNDLIIESNKKIISLSGIMGSKDTSVTEITSSICVCAETIDSNFIKNTSKRLKLRTQSSSIFEKYSCEKNAIEGLFRYIFLLKKYNLIDEDTYKNISLMASKENNSKKRIIDLFHHEIESFIGIISLDSDYIVSIFTQLGFDVSTFNHENGLWYSIFIPSFRNTEDIYDKASLIKEISRIYGYDNIKPISPSLQIQDKKISTPIWISNLKEKIVESFNSYEITSYGLVDNQFASKIKYKFNPYLALKLGHSENHNELIQELTPHIIKTFQQIQEVEKVESLFEFGTTWSLKNGINEKKTCVIGWKIKNPENYDFYFYKNKINRLLKSFFIDNLIWNNSDENILPIYLSNYKSTIYNGNNKIIGFAGFIDPLLLLDLSISYGIFIIEFNYELLQPKILSNKKENNFIDISCLVNKNISGDFILKEYKIKYKYTVFIIDWFEKPEWKEERSITFRIYLEKKEDDTKKISDSFLTILSTIIEI